MILETKVKQNKKKKKWVLPRHKAIVVLAKPVVKLMVYLKYGLWVKPDKTFADRQYLIIMNHQTAYDQFFVSMVFNKPVYYIASEDLFSMGLLSRLLRWAVAPIPIKKQTTDVQAVMNCLKVAREGGTIALAPEGNRTFSGLPVHMNPAIIPLIKKLGLPLAIFRIEGGFGVHPRWSDVCRKGPMKTYVSRVIEPEEYKSLSKEELFQLIQQEMYVDERVTGGEYPHKESAQYLERAMYVCPSCGLSEFESQGDTIRCKKCGLGAQYLPNKQLKGVGGSFPYLYLADWYQHQFDYVNQFDTLAHLSEAIYTDTVQLSRVKPYSHKEILMESVPLKLFGDRLELGDLTLPHSGTSVITVLGKNKLNIYHDGTIYQIQGDKRFNALKYMNLFYRHQNQVTGDEHNEFLGI